MTQEIKEINVKYLLHDKSTQLRVFAEIRRRWVTFAGKYRIPYCIYFSPYPKVWRVSTRPLFSRQGRIGWFWYSGSVQPKDFKYGIVKDLSDFGFKIVGYSEYEMFFDQTMVINPNHPDIKGPARYWWKNHTFRELATAPN